MRSHIEKQKRLTLRVPEIAEALAVGKKSAYAERTPQRNRIAAGFVRADAGTTNRREHRRRGPIVWQRVWR